MRNKILIVATSEDQEALENILQEVVEEGGELFLSEKREDGLAILKKELPQLVFLDAHLAGQESDWVLTGVQVILICNKEGTNKSADYISKPFKPNQVLEKCNSALNKEPAAPIPPM